MSSNCAAASCSQSSLQRCWPLRDDCCRLINSSTDGLESNLAVCPRGLHQHVPQQANNNMSAAVVNRHQTVSGSTAVWAAVDKNTLANIVDRLTENDTDSCFDVDDLPSSSVTQSHDQRPSSYQPLSEPPVTTADWNTNWQQTVNNSSSWNSDSNQFQSVEQTSVPGSASVSGWTGSCSLLAVSCSRGHWKQVECEAAPMSIYASGTINCVDDCLTSSYATASTACVPPECATAATKFHTSCQQTTQQPQTSSLTNEWKQGEVKRSKLEPDEVGLKKFDMVDSGRMHEVVAGRSAGLELWASVSKSLVGQLFDELLHEQDQPLLHPSALHTVNYSHPSNFPRHPPRRRSDVSNDVNSSAAWRMALEAYKCKSELRVSTNTTVGGCRKRRHHGNRHSV